MAFSCVFPSGYTLSGSEAAKYDVAKRFTLLSLWEAQNLTLIEAEECEVIPGDGTFNWSVSVDTTGFDIDGWSGLSAINFISIENIDPPDGIWDDSKYSLETTNEFGINSTIDFLKFKGLQFKYLGSQNTRGCIRLRGGDCLIESCIARKDSASTATNSYGFYWFLAPDGRIKNCVSYDWDNSGNAAMRFRTAAAGSMFAYSNTVTGSTNGFRMNNGNTVFINNIAFDNIDDYENTLATGSTNNAFSDGVSVGTDPIDISAEIGTDLFVDFANDDYHLKSGTVLEDAGIDLVSDSDLPVPFDFEGNSRGDPPDLGPFEIVADGSVGVSFGTSVVAGIGISTHVGVGSSSGISIVSGVGASTNIGLGISTGISAVLGIGISSNSGIGSSSGISTVFGVGVSGTPDSGVGLSSGISVAIGIGISDNGGTGSSVGVSTVSGIGISTHAGVGSSTGISTVSGVGEFSTVGSGVGSVSGTSDATGIVESTNSGIGSSIGISAASGVGSFITFSDGVGSAIGISIVFGVGAGVAGGIINGALEILVEIDFGGIDISIEEITIIVDIGE